MRISDWSSDVCSSDLLSGAIFASRGALTLCRSALGQNLALKRFSYANDSLLLITGLTLMFTTHQYPIAQDWLTVKLTLVLVYIGLGVMALRKGRSARARALYFVAAIIVYRSEEHTSELQSLMRTSSAVFC